MDFRSCVKLCWLVTFLLLTATTRPADSQEPGTLPPASLSGRAESATAPPSTPGATVASPAGEAPIEPKAFLMLDSAGNPVMVPGMTFEKLDRLMRLEEGLEKPPQPYSIDSVSIVGRVVDEHAELNVSVRITVEPSEGNWVAIPLRMENFHRTGPADVSGVERYRMDLASDGSGYLLHVQSETRRTVVVGMRVVVRVAPAPNAAIDFRLPEALCSISLNIPDVGVSASVVGRGDEVLQTQSAGRATDITVEAGGGIFSLRYGTQVPVLDNRPVLETDSRIIVDWQQADNSPLVAYSLSVRNMRGELPKVSLTIPGAVRLLQQPEVLNAGPFEVLDAVDLEGNDAIATGLGIRSGETLRRIDVMPSSPRGDTRMELAINGQMRSEKGLSGGMVIVSPVVVEGAIQQAGEIEVRTPKDFRLRWKPAPWIRSVWEKEESETLTSRVYRFRFDRVPFELPIWLSARARQLQIESDWRLTLYDSLASLRMVMRTNGSIPDTRVLPINIGPWKVQSVFIADTTKAVEADRIGDVLEIDLSTLPSGGSEGDRIEVVLVKSLAPGETKVDFPLPQFTGGDEAIGTLPSTLSVVSQNESRFILDLASSVGIGEVLRGNSPIASTPTTPENMAGDSQYRLPEVAQPSRLVGFLVRERPSVSLLADAEISVVADKITEVIDWTIYPQGSLRGRLPITWGNAADRPAADIVAPAAVEGPLSVDSPPSAPLPPLEGVQPQTAVPDVAGSASGSANTSPELTTASPELTGPSSATTVGERDIPFPLSPLIPWTVVVDDTPATIRMDAEGQYQIYCDRLGGGPHRVRFRRTRPLTMTPSGPVRIAGIFLPRPTLPDTTLRGPIVVRLRGSSQRELSAQGDDGRWVDELTLLALPQNDLAIQLRRIEKQEDDFIVRRGVLRTVLGDSVHHEQFISAIEGGGTLRIGLPKSLGGARALATVDGVQVEVLRDIENRCVIRLGDVGLHQVDLQIWASRSSSWAMDPVKPLMTLPVGIERLYWQVIVPSDDHLIWATETMGRAMKWELNRWRLNRVPLKTDASLIEWTGTRSDALMPPGNRYLFVGMDAGSLGAMTMSRLAIWLVVGAVVLLVSIAFTYVPSIRHPLTAVLAAVLLSGLLLLLPDAAIIAGQLVIVAMLMVAVMTGVRQLLSTRRSDRLLAPSREPENPTTRNVSPVRDAPAESFAPSPEALITGGSAVEAR